MKVQFCANPDCIACGEMNRLLSECVTLVDVLDAADGPVGDWPADSLTKAQDLVRGLARVMGTADRHVVAASRWF